MVGASRTGWEGGSVEGGGGERSKPKGGFWLVRKYFTSHP